jgi:hypothetical protein
MATSTMRAIILVLAVALGAVVVGKAFPNASAAFTAQPIVHPSQSPTPQPSASHPKKKTTHPSSSPSSSPGGGGAVHPGSVKVLVENGTHKSGLAATTSQTLAAAGYNMQPARDTATQSETTTTVYYLASAQAAAQAIHTRYFPSAHLVPAPTALGTADDVIIVLGADFTGTA